ncbi:MAG TPA: ABC transporter permease, partial [Puia sp.]|nr:ABC transporter permease [Puia sp.]
MLKNYFKIAWRNLEKNKFFGAINISGLAMGLAVGILLLLWVQDELSFDGFHKNGKNIFRATAVFKQDNGGNIYWGTTPAPLAVFGKKEVPEIRNSCRLSDQWAVSFLEFKNQKIFDIKPGLADPSFFNVFSFSLLKGNPQVPFPDDHSIILSESVAKKIFGSEDPMGKTLTTDNKDLFRVCGLMKDPPNHSSIRYNVIFNFDLLQHNYDGKGYWKSLNEDWGNYNYDTYFQMQSGANPVSVGKKLSDIHRRNQPGDFTNVLSYVLQPLTHVHLYSVDGKDEGIRIVRIFFIVAIIVLMIACINYTNLVTARATKRAKEISMRKIIGARKTTLFWQFLNETLLILVISLLIATILIYLVLPLYNDIAGKQIVFHPYDLRVLFVYGCTFVVTLIMAGIYPALTLSSFKPLEALKGKFSVLGRDIVFRKFLVVVQFTFSVVLIVTTFIIGKQLQYLREKNLGYDKSNVLTFGFRGIGDH